jgi:hypothetical protein
MLQGKDELAVRDFLSGVHFASKCADVTAIPIGKGQAVGMSKRQS